MQQSHLTGAPSAQVMEASATPIVPGQGAPFASTRRTRPPFTRWIQAKHTAARARVLAAFTAQDGYEDDGQGSARMWLRWQTRVTKAAAAGAVGWARRLAAHPVIARALAGGEISPSWARAVCGWSERLPEAVRDDADQILAGA